MSRKSVEPIANWAGVLPRTVQEFLGLSKWDESAVRDLASDQTLGGADRALGRYLRPDLLIVDDMGIKHLPRQSGEHLFEIVMRRHERRTTVMTSNRPIEDWGKRIGDVPAATAILDRSLQHGEILTITGQSYRLKDRACSPEA